MISQVLGNRCQTVTRSRLRSGGPLCLAVLLLTGVSAVCVADTYPQRPRIDLCGVWEFQLDPQDQGVGQDWFSAGPAYGDTIQVPGNWQAQGFGPAKDHLRNDYQGKAWYRRTASIPREWSEKRIWLHLGGTSNTADVYVNGQKVGHVEGAITPYEFDVTEAIRVGDQNTIVCHVDSTGMAPGGLFNFIGRWGGLYREVHLEARAAIAIDDVFVIPDVLTATAHTRVVLARSAVAEPWQGRVQVRIAPVAGGDAVDRQAAIRFAAGQAESEPTTVDLKIEPLRTWSPEDPFLYSVELLLIDGERVVDAVRDRFGMRQFTVGEGGVLLLNGQPYFIRGLGDDTVEVLHGTQPPDKQVFVERLKMAKRYGFTGIRFLGNTPIKEYFEAADEVGMLVMCEGQVYHKPKESIPLLKKQVTRIAKAFRNHPSWYLFSAGNEFFECQGASPDPEWMDYIRYAHDTFKQLDRTRFFIASDGADVFPADVITQAATFGGPPTGGGAEQQFDGLIDEVAYFSRALSEEELLKTADANKDNYADVVRSLGPSGYWRLEEKQVGIAFDSSGRERHGSYDASMTQDSFRKPGMAEKTAANAAILVNVRSRGVSLKEVAAATFAKGNEPFSVSLWVRPEGFRRGDFGTPLSIGATVRGAALLIAEDGKDGMGQLRLGRYFDDFHVSSGGLIARQWNHVGITYDGTTLKLYLNGKLDSSVKVKLAVVPVDARIGRSITDAPVPDVPWADAQQYASRPHIWHEFPNTYVGPFPHLDVMDRYTGVFVDNNCLAYHRRQMAALGLTEQYPRIQRRSVDLFYLYLKEQFENARRSPTMDGYGYWCFTDFPGDVEGDMTTYGIFNTLYEPEKFPDPQPLLEFNRETVLLMNQTLGQRVLSTGETRQASLAVSHYGTQPVSDGTLFWELRAGDTVLQEGRIDAVAVRVGEVKPLGNITLGPVAATQGQHLELAVRLESIACRQTNHWDFWVFPRQKDALPAVRMINLTGLKSLDERYDIAAEATWAQADVAIVAGPTVEALQQAAAGKTLVVLPPPESLARPRAMTFWPGWIQSIGTWIETHPALRDFPHEGFCSLQFYRLFGDGVQALNTTDPGTPERENLAPIINGMRQDYDPVLGGNWAAVHNRWKFYRYGLLTEGRLGEGKILICCLNVLGGIENQQPEAGYLLDCLVEYAGSEQFAPQTPPMTVDEAKQIFRVEVVPRADAGRRR